jgi:hypothetical protein
MNSPPFQASGNARCLKNFRPDLLVEWVPIRTIRCNPAAPREHSDRQVKQIGWSISTFGFLVPILVDNGQCPRRGRAPARSRKNRHA